MCEQVIDKLVPRLAHADSSNHLRAGTVKVLSQVVQQLQIGVVPFGVFLVVPLMGAMTDSSEDVRKLASQTFANVVQLLPLDPVGSLPVDFPQQLVEQKKTQSGLLQQLLDPSAAADYIVPLQINATLRPYQQAGASTLRM